ncbi:hypothetical protein SASPL_126595 [Salvia splendens]|uniref:Fanconi Anaemia group E protein C-terminal domain-containing protein n=1 Tax=Salvia splendens TaxID=180675 RepID=A0A8X8XFX7_SALSN|nr:uncharacterized protein LOC121746625 [Salvia splendens]KAG6413880.1 hypothetical protein SASPL_126595 [Salvia splendens]
MESWIPLLQVFLNSTCPETEASKWLEEMFNPPASYSPRISTTSFLSLLMRPSNNSAVQHSSPQEKRVMWIETLPSVVQARILSFLAYEHQRFCTRELCRLARVLLSEGRRVDFWVKKAAQQLLDLVSLSNYQWLSHLNLESEEETEEDDFYMMPDWLRDAAIDGESVFPWLPMSVDELSAKMPLTGSSGGDEDDLLIDVEESKQKNIDVVMVEIGEDESNIDNEVEKVAKSLKTELLHIDSNLKAVELAREIRKLCSGGRRQRLLILNLIEPWSADDETATVLLCHLSDGIDADECDWPSHILCSVFLPKFLVLNEPSSRVLLNATLDYCKTHQKAAEYALLFPLVLRKDGVNSPICDVLTRVVRECLHPAHVSAFCQKLLTKDEDVLRFVCLPCHRCLISEELVWTESLFSLWRNILDHNVHLMQDSVDQLVEQVCKYSKRYSKSLKFANFVLCLINKCTPSLRPHKLILTAAVEKSDTLVTKSILSKLSAL